MFNINVLVENLSNSCLYGCLLGLFAFLMVKLFSFLSFAREEGEYLPILHAACDPECIIQGYTVKRSDFIEVYLPAKTEDAPKKVKVFGKFFGKSKDDFIFIKQDDGNVVVCEVKHIEKDDIVHIHRRYFMFWRTIV